MEALAFVLSGPWRAPTLFRGNGGQGLGAGVASLLFCFQSICPKTLSFKAVMSV